MNEKMMRLIGCFAIAGMMTGATNAMATATCDKFEFKDSKDKPMELEAIVSGSNNEESVEVTLCLGHTSGVLPVELWGAVVKQGEQTVLYNLAEEAATSGMVLSGNVPRPEVKEGIGTRSWLMIPHGVTPTKLKLSSIKLLELDVDIEADEPNGMRLRSQETSTVLSPQLLDAKG